MRADTSVNIIQLRLRSHMYGAGQANVFSPRTGTHLNFRRVESRLYCLNEINNRLRKAILSFAHDFDGEVARKIN